MVAGTAHTSMKPFQSPASNFCSIKKFMNSASHNKADNPSFFELVYQVVRLIPKGRVTTYGAIAAYLGSKQSSRAVGYALNGAHFIKPKVPAQRVVNRNGMLSGKAHFETPTRMQELLEKEGVIVKDETIQNFSKHFWDPAKELSL
jgi:methylated-DNA-protein-cysteine methyltransferase-like protein